MKKNIKIENNLYDLFFVNKKERFSSKELEIYQENKSIFTKDSLTDEILSLKKEETEDLLAYMVNKKLLEDITLYRLITNEEFIKRGYTQFILDNITHIPSILFLSNLGLEIATLVKINSSTIPTENSGKIPLIIKALSHHVEEELKDSYKSKKKTLIDINNVILSLTQNEQFLRDKEHSAYKEDIKRYTCNFILSNTTRPFNLLTKLGINLKSIDLLQELKQVSNNQSTSILKNLMDFQSYSILLEALKLKKQNGVLEKYIENNPLELLVLIKKGSSSSNQVELAEKIIVEEMRVKHKNSRNNTEDAIELFKKMLKGENKKVLWYPDKEMENIKMLDIILGHYPDVDWDKKINSNLKSKEGVSLGYLIKVVLINLCVDNFALKNTYAHNKTPLSPEEVNVSLKFIKNTNIEDSLNLINSYTQSLENVIKRKNAGEVDFSSNDKIAGIMVGCMLLLKGHSNNQDIYSSKEITEFVTIMDTYNNIDFFAERESITMDLKTELNTLKENRLKAIVGTQENKTKPIRKI